MRQKQKKLILGIAVLLAVAVLILSQTGFDLPFAISGTNTLSLTQAQLQSNNNFLSGKVWLLTFSSGGLGQKYTGTFSPSDVQSTTSDSSTTTKDFTLDVQYSDQTCNYAIQQTSLNKPIYDIQEITWTSIPFTAPCNFDEAHEKGLTIVLYTKGFLLTCHALGYNTQSPVGNLQNPNLESEFTININAGGKTASKTINTLSESTQGAIGDFAYASWGGNLVSGQSCPSQSTYKSAYVNGNWKTISSSAYANYISQINAIPPTSESAWNIYVSNLKNAVAQSKQSLTFGSINSQTSLTNAVVKITLQNQIQFPVTTLYIKADTIGIYTPTPEIKLVNADSSCFATGEQGGITVNLQNVGQETGTWNVYATCPAPFTSNSNLQVSLNAGASTTKIIPISGSASSEQKAQCIIYAESPAGKKQLSADVCVKPQITCEANKIFCGVSGISEVIKQCSSNGATSSIKQICGVGETCEVDKCVAGSSGGSSGENVIGDFFNNLFGGVFDFFKILKIGFSLVALTFSSLFLKDLISSFRALKRKSGIAWAISIVLGLIVGYLVWLSFWFLILLGIIVVLKVVMGR